MSGFPFIPPGPLPTHQSALPSQDPLAAEAAALQIGSASLSSYGSLPNPQAVYEAVNTGSASTIAAAAQQGSPLFEAELSGSPAGQPMSSAAPYSAVPATIDNTTSPIWTYNAKADPGAQANLLNKPENASFQALGMVPEVNMGWLRAQRTAKPGTIKKWQALLSKDGFYQPGDGSGSHTTGVWDTATESAMQGFMIARVLPDALYSQDPRVQTNAGQFLNALGFDWTSMQSNLRDPSVQAQVAQQWAAAQGPGTQTTPMSNLQAYANLYGPNALPESYQAAITPNWTESLRNTITGAPLIGYLNDVPGLSTGFHAVVNALTLNLDPGKIGEDPRQQQADEIAQKAKQLDKLTPSEIANMKPLLQSVQANSGWLGFMDQWDHERNAILLSIGMVAKEAFTGGKWENPFDLSSSSNAWVQSHADNMASVIFGDQWAQDNPGWAGIMNFAINTADDPLSYFNIIGDAERVQKFQGVRTLKNVIGDDGARQAMSNLIGKNVREKIANGFFKGAREANKQKKLYGIADQLDLIGGVHSGAYAQRHADFIKQVFAEPDEHKAWDLFMNGDDKGNKGFGYLVNSGKSLYNTRAAWEGLAQVKDTKILGKLRVVMGLGEQSPFNLINAPESAVRSFRNYGILAHMSPEELAPLLDHFYEVARTDPNNVLAAAHEVQDAIMKAYHDRTGVTEQMLLEHSNAVQAGRKTIDTGDPTGRGNVELMAPRPEAKQRGDVKEVSTGPAALKEDLRREQSAQLSVLRRDYSDAVQGGLPRAVIQDLERQINEISRPVPMFTTQLADQFKMPYTPYEMVTAKWAPLRASEQIQGAIKADALMGIWRRWTIARVSSALRLTLGDDTIRPATLLMSMGHPIIATHYLATQIGRSLGLIVPGAPRFLLSDAQKAGRAAADEAGVPIGDAYSKVAGATGRFRGLRVRQLQDVLAILEQNPDARELLQNFAHLTGELNVHTFQPYIAGSPGWAKAMANVIDNHFRQDPMVQEWLKAYRHEQPQSTLQHMRNYVEKINPQDPNYSKVKAWLHAQGGDEDQASFDFVINRWDQHVKLLMQNKDIREMSRKGADINKLKALNRKKGYQSTYELPTISARPEAGQSSNAFMNLLNKYPHMIFENITKPMVDSARVHGFLAVKDLYDRQMREYFKDHPRASAPGWDHEVEQEATARAIDWVVNNTYQGGRSVLGGTVRNAFPFYGAATNMDRFFMRQAFAKPVIGMAALRAATASQSTQNNPNPAMSGLQGVLAHLGFGAGEGMTFDPMHAFFLTSDGLGSFVPGTGPLFAPIWSAVAGNQGLADALSNIPGIGTQIDFATGEATPEFPWLGDLLQGSYMSLTGQQLNIPLVTNTASRTDQKINEKIQQWDRNKEGSNPDGTVSPSDQQAIVREVGRDETLQGAAQFLMPMTPAVADTQGQAISQAMDLWRNADTSGAKDQITADALGVSLKTWQAALAGTQGAPNIVDLLSKHGDSPGVLMAYQDSRLSPETRDAIANAQPWVISGSASKYQYTTSQTPASLAQWNLMRSLGQVQTLQPFGSTNTFMSKIAKEKDINTGWLQYDNLKNWEYNTLAANGWTTQSPLYSQWKAAYFDPQVSKLQESNPQWWSQFSAGGDTSSAPGLMKASAPLRTLQTWEVIPQHADFENAQSVLWRNTLAAQQQAASAIYSLRLTGGSQAEQDLIMQSLQQQLQSLAALDPTFAEQLSGYRFSKVEDIVNLMADEMGAQQTLGNQAAVPTVQP